MNKTYNTCRFLVFVKFLFALIMGSLIVNNLKLINTTCFYFFRYFVIKVMEGGKTAYLGLGFSDRADSFDVNTTLHDHFKGIKVKALAGPCLLLFWPAVSLFHFSHS